MPSIREAEKQAESQVRSWGFSHVFTWQDGPGAHYTPHSHSGKTTHLILDGSLTMRYPNDPNPEKVSMGKGERWDVEAGKLHEVWVGEAGCKYVIGE